MVHMPGAGPIGSGRRRGLPPPTPRPRRWRDLNGRLWWYALRRGFDTFLRQQCVDMAAALTFYAVLALVPAFMVLVGLLGLIGMDDSTVEFLLDVLHAVAPAGVADALRGPLYGFTAISLAPVPLAALVVVTLGTASLYQGALARAMNRVYEVMEGRPLLLLPPLQYLTTALLILGCCAMMVTLIASPAIMEAAGGAIGLDRAAVQLWNTLRWPVLIALAMVVVAVVYRTAPNSRPEGVRWLIPGAVLAVALGVGASWALTFYLARLYPRLDLNYGTLSGLIVLLMWLWVCNLALVIGAVLNAELARARRLAAGLPAEDDQLTPPIDIRRSVGFTARRHMLVREGARHRRAAEEERRRG